MTEKAVWHIVKEFAAKVRIDKLTTFRRKNRFWAGNCPGWPEMQEPSRDKKPRRSDPPGL
jgi:hypothetical protein